MFVQEKKKWKKEVGLGKEGGGGGGGGGGGEKFNSIFH